MDVRSLFFLPFNRLFNSIRNGSNTLYNFGYDIITASTIFNDYTSENRKLAMVLSNPAVLKVISLQCDLFSMGKVYDYDQDDNIIEEKDSEILQMLKKPNPFQSRAQFLWDFMFWNMMGTAYLYIDSSVIGENKMYFLDPRKIDWPYDLDKMRDKLVFSPQKLKEMDKMIITYRYDDGTTFKFPLSKLIVITDLTNSLGNWHKGPSRLEALYKIVSNSEYALDSKNINVRYTSKFLVGSSNDTSKMGLSTEEKEDIETKVDSMEKKVWAVKTPVEIRRFVENLANLQLDQAYLADYFLIGNMYGIPRDVLEAYNSATYENQEKARAAHVNYCFDPKGNQFMNAIEDHFGYENNLVMSWDHLPFMQVFEKERAEVAKMKIESLNLLLQMGVKLDQANEFLDTNFELNEESVQQGQAQGAGESQTEGDQLEEGGQKIRRIGVR